MVRESNELAKWFIVFITLFAILSSVEGEIVFFATTVIGAKTYTFSTFFLIAKHLQAFIGLYAAHYKSKNIFITKWILSLIEITCIGMALGFVDFEKLYHDMFINSDVPPKYDHHLKVLTVTYLIYTVIIKTLEFFSTFYLSFDDESLKAFEFESAQASLTRTLTPAPISINILDHRKDKPAAHHKSPKSGNKNHPMTRHSEQSQDKYTSPTHFISNAQPGTTDTTIPSIKSPSQGHTEDGSDIFSNPYATAGTHKVGSHSKSYKPSQTNPAPLQTVTKKEE